MRKPISLTKSAEIFGVSRGTLSDWIARGCPYVGKADKARGIEWSLDTAAVHKWKVESSVKDAVAAYETEDGGISKEEADRRRAIALAIVAEVEADEALKKVMLVSDAHEMVADFCQVIKSGIGNATTKIAGRFNSSRTPAEFRDLCTVEFNRAYADAEQQLNEAWDGKRINDGDQSEVEE